MAARPATIDAYLAALPARERAALGKLRRAILSAAPGASECLMYGMPAFRVNGRALVAMRAAAKHCALHPMDAETLRALAAELAGYDTSPGTLRFDASDPLPATLVRKIVRARLARHAALEAKRTGAAKRAHAKVRGKRGAAKRRMRRARRTP